MVDFEASKAKEHLRIFAVLATEVKGNLWFYCFGFQSKGNPKVVYCFEASKVKETQMFFAVLASQLKDA